MEPWSIGLVVLVVVGLAVIAFGALHDRRRNRRRAAEMLAPPPRAIPQLSPTAAAPAYVSELQARRPPAGPSHELTAAERSRLEAELAAASTVAIRAGYLSKDFVTDAPTRRAVLDDPLVAVCAGPVLSIRELLGVVEQALRSGRALVVVAESYAAEVSATLAVNAIQRKLALVAVAAEAEDAATVARVSHAIVLDPGDRHSGWLAPDQLGTVRRWVSNPSTSHLMTSLVVTSPDLAPST